MVAFTSAAVKSEPSWNVTSSLSSTVAVVPLSDQPSLFARPSESCPPLPGWNWMSVSKIWFVTFATSPLVVCCGS